MAKSPEKTNIHLKSEKTSDSYDLRIWGSDIKRTKVQVFANSKILNTINLNGSGTFHIRGEITGITHIYICVMVTCLYLPKIRFAVPICSIERYNLELEFNFISHFCSWQMKNSLLLSKMIRCQVQEMAKKNSEMEYEEDSIKNV